MSPESPRNENKELDKFEDFNLKGKKITREPLDTNKIWKDLSEIKISQEIISILKRNFQENNIKHVISLAGGGANGLVGNFSLIYLLDQYDLMENIDEIWGVSAGSIIGAAYCSGLKPIDILALLIGINNRDFIHFSGKGIRKGGGYLYNDKFHDFFDNKFQHRTVKDCIKPFFAIAVEFDGHSEQTHTFEEGSLADVITASMSLQNLFEPAIINGVNYVDGGLIETTPSISVWERHRRSNDPRLLAILGTCFGEDHFEPNHHTFPMKAKNLLRVYQYQLTLDQRERVRQNPNCKMGMIRLNIDIGQMDFAHLGNYILPAYQQLVEKISTMALHRHFGELL